MAKDDTVTVAECLNLARRYDAYTFYREGALFAVFNHGRDRVALEHSFLRPYAFSTVKDGDDLAIIWEAYGWRVLSRRLSWRLTPLALQFATPEWRWQLTRADLREWWDNEGAPFVRLKRI